jgi:thimet oligopeptidase
MAKSAKAVREFLGRVRQAVKAPAEAELAELRAMHVKLGSRADEPIVAADRLYLEEQVRAAKYGLDSKRLAQFFEVGRVKQGLLELTAKLFGISWRPSDGPTWHPDVEAYEVVDGARVLGRFYLDLFPRPNKFKHAAVFGIRPRRVFADGETTVPIAALVCNFAKPTSGQPALMGHEEVVTFFHELGHVLHQLLTESRFASFSGTATARDFVETPSQMFEEWAWRREVLDLFARHFETGERLPDDLFAAMHRARGFGRALGTQRQLFLAALDFEYHTRPAGFDTGAVLRELWDAWQPFAFVEGTCFQATFGHLVGYDAGYYGYQWALSLSRDVLTRFEREGWLDPRVASAWRAAVLSKGGCEDETEMVARFLGRAPGPDAYVAYLAGKSAA